MSFDLNEFLYGQSITAYEYFGAHFITHNKKKGVMFRLYAPMAEDVSVIGEFNNWDVTTHKMNKIDVNGIFELFVPNLVNYQGYKFHFKNAKGQYVDKADPYAFYSAYRPDGYSRLFDYENFIWHDDKYLKNRTLSFSEPLAIYEMHLGSWLGKKDNRFLSYEEIADYLIPYLQENGFNAIEIMPITQYPFDGSWGYQATGFYSVDSRYGNPMQLMSFVDRMHQAGIKVILDYVLVHFATDDFGLIEFDGSRMYEYSDDHNAISQWGSRLFDLGKDPVRSFMMSSVNYFVTYFHFDGVRFDAISNVIYWHGNSSIGENSGAIEFIKRLTGKMHIFHKDVMLIAEDSSSYKGVTGKLEYGGLGFDYKWDLGWMNDTLKYYALDPIYRKYHHNLINFSMAYFFSEKFLLPLSHDEVVHGKGTIINKINGDYHNKFAQLRNLYTYMWSHPGKKLSFMGNELGSFDEWNENKSLPWVLKTYPAHDSISRLIRDLNLIYQNEKAMYLDEYNYQNFEWTMVDNNNDSIFSFVRRYQDEELLFVFNMTPNYYEYYEIPVIKEGMYREIFNSDKDVYGGNNLYNGVLLETGVGGKEFKPFHITIKIASFGAMIFKLVK